MFIHFAQIIAISLKSQSGYLTYKNGKFNFQDKPDNNINIIESNAKIAIAIRSDIDPNLDVYMCYDNTKIYPCNFPHYWEKLNNSEGFNLRAKIDCINDNLDLDSCKNAALFNLEINDKEENNNDLIKNFNGFLYPESMNFDRDQLLESEYHDIEKHRKIANQEGNDISNKISNVPQVDKKQLIFPSEYRNDDLRYENTNRQ